MHHNTRFSAKECQIKIVWGLESYVCEPPVFWLSNLDQLSAPLSRQDKGCIFWKILLPSFTKKYLHQTTSEFDHKGQDPLML